MIIEEKNKIAAGADERTPSHSQYFSWINNTNEGSTEAQTLINLAYFAFLKKAYNMCLDIYAWDAGNLDGARETYESMDSLKIKKQYPNGYAPIVEAAQKNGTRLGVWCGPDGFGNTPEETKMRQEQMISLCRDYNFALFKMDGVCGGLRPEYRECFVEMMKECRKYSPDLVLLNHRLDLGDEGTKHATTFLWEGMETYVDVHIGNKVTAPHHRAFFNDRGNVPGLLRLTEDHGVCISSCIDYFEDDLIFQAFGRSLILAPEIYGNPWLMRDDEQAHLARIYNLHRRYRDILVTGMLLPAGDTYPQSSVSRGSASKRFITAGNQSWEKDYLHMRLDMEIGLAPCKKVSVILHHPYERFLGEFEYGAVVDVPLMPFRAALIEVCDSREADCMLQGCEYEVLHEDASGKIDRIKIVSSNGKVSYTDGSPIDKDIPAFDNTLRAPIKLGELDSTAFTEIPADVEKQIETAMFIQNHDSLEARSMKRSGETKIPEVQAARDAFFNQRTYQVRGPECRFAFDNKEDTFYDGISRVFHDWWIYDLRQDNGCLRVDFGAEYKADFVQFEYFDVNQASEHNIIKQYIPAKCDFSIDLLKWTESTLEDIETLRYETIDVLVEGVHKIIQKDGRRRVITYPIDGAVRYLRMPCPIDHIYKIALVKDGKEITLDAPRANNLMAYKREVVYAKEMKLTISPDDFREGCYITVGLEGEHGSEGAYAIIECEGTYLGAFDRSPSYNAIPWEIVSYTVAADHHYSYYFAVTPDMCGKELTVRVLGFDNEKKDYAVTAYLCDKNAELDGIVLEL